ncbi:hypothetical protein Bhyg_02282, partial [Pseudolycoriella hygida]
KSINDLPPEILAKIFNYLKQRPLGWATATCQHWKEIIEDTCLWKLDLNCDYYCSPNMMIHYLQRSNRKFHEIVVFNRKKRVKPNKMNSQNWKYWMRMIVHLASSSVSNDRRISAN